MKKAVIILIFLSLSVLAEAQTRIPEGYKGMTWGTDLSKAMSQIDSYPISSCISHDNKITSVFSLLATDPERMNVVLFFYRGKLFSVISDLKLTVSEMTGRIKGTYGDPVVSRQKAFVDGQNIIRTVWDDGITGLEIDEYPSGAKIRSYSKAYIAEAENTVQP